MTTSIRILELHIEKLKRSIAECESIEPEMTSDIMFADESIAEYKSEIEKVSKDIQLLSSKEGGVTEQKLFENLKTAFAHQIIVEGLPLNSEHVNRFAEITFRLYKESHSNSVVTEISDGWISVKDRLPQEYDKQVLVRVTGNAAIIGYLHERGHWIIQAITSSYKENNLHMVTHWMPLPTPPKNS